MSKIDDGGPAFPVIPPVDPNLGFGTPAEFPYPSEGISIRDYFATIIDKDEYGDVLYRAGISRSLGLALAGEKPPERLHDHATAEEVAKHQLENLDWHLRLRAAVRYRMADMMLEARKKQ